MLLILVVTIALTLRLFSTLNKGYFPQDDTGLLFGWTQAAPDVSFEEMRRPFDEKFRFRSGDEDTGVNIEIKPVEFPMLGYIGCGLTI